MLTVRSPHMSYSLGLHLRLTVVPHVLQSQASSQTYHRPTCRSLMKTHVPFVHLLQEEQVHNILTPEAEKC